MNQEQQMSNDKNDLFISTKFTKAMADYMQPWTAMAQAANDAMSISNPNYITKPMRTTPDMERYAEIWVKFAKEGIHKYPAALTDPNLDDVKFLGYPHRHMFHFCVGIEVYHNDRDIEFIQFKRWLIGLYDEAIIQLDYKSCEMIADDLYEQISDKYPGRNVTIEVSEDNENGCKITYQKVKTNDQE